MITYEIKQKINLDEIIILSGSIGMAGGAICRILEFMVMEIKIMDMFTNVKLSFAMVQYIAIKFLKSLDYFNNY